jgi:hypothetical protein
MWTKLSLLPEEEPSRDLDARINSMIAGFRQGMQAARHLPPIRPTIVEWLRGLWPRQPALQFTFAVVLLGLGLLIGQLEIRWRPGAGRVAADEAALAPLREELAQLREQVALARLEQQSASERLRAVEWSGRLRQPQERVLAALLRTLDADPNVNVRLAAVDALQPFADQPRVRRAFLDSLPRQESPLVQMELIDVMVERGEQDAAPVLQALLQKAELNESVRQRAEWGLRQL